MSDASDAPRKRLDSVRGRVDQGRDRAQRTLVWQVWIRMLEIEFVDRGIALAGKAFVSFFPLVIVVAAFLPASIRSSIFETLTNRLGVRGDALETARDAFASSDDIRKATGLFGLALTFFYASSFTTALQRVYLRAWRRPPAHKAGAYARGPAWLAVMLASMAFLGGARGLVGGAPGIALFVVISLVTTSALWWFTSWFLLQGEVRWRVLIPTGVITSVVMSGYAISATFWMPGLVIRNEAQFGFFGVALALVSWFSGAAICILVGACAGPVFAEDDGSIGRLVRGRDPAVLVEGAAPSLVAPDRELRLRDAFRPGEGA